MRFPKLVTTTVLSLATLGSSRPLEAQEFSPAACFPASTILYVEVDVGGLRAAIPETPFGKIYAYPQFQKALGRLPRMIRQQITQQTGELNELLGGDIEIDSHHTVEESYLALEYTMSHQPLPHPI